MLPGQSRLGGGSANVSLLPVGCRCCSLFPWLALTRCSAPAPHLGCTTTTLLQLSFGPISWLLVGEVFPLKVRQAPAAVPAPAAVLVPAAAAAAAAPAVSGQPSPRPSAPLPLLVSLCWAAGARRLQWPPSPTLAQTSWFPWRCPAYRRPGGKQVGRRGGACQRLGAREAGRQAGGCGARRGGGGPGRRHLEC